MEERRGFFFLSGVEFCFSTGCLLFFISSSSWKWASRCLHWFLDGSPGCWRTLLSVSNLQPFKPQREPSSPLKHLYHIHSYGLLYAFYLAQIHLTTFFFLFFPRGMDLNWCLSTRLFPRLSSVHVFPAVHSAALCYFWHVWSVKVFTQILGHTSKSCSLKSRRLSWDWGIRRVVCCYGGRWRRRTARR